MKSRFLQNTTPEEDRAIERKLCETSLKYICVNILGFKDWDICHDELEADIKKSSRQDQLFLLPRGHLKTSIITIGYTIQEILKNPDITILLASAIRDNAASFLSEIKEYLTKTTLPKLYGKFDSSEEKGGLWNMDVIKILQRKIPNKTPTISVAGADHALASQHYDLIVADDLVNRQTVSTLDQIKKTYKFYSDLQDLRNPGKPVRIIGTRWDDRDLYGTIIKAEAALPAKSKSFDLFVRGATRGKNDVDAPVIFPKKFTNDMLRTLLAKKGTWEFYGQYFNDPVPSASRHFAEPNHYWYDRAPLSCRRFVSVDLATGEPGKNAASEGEAQTDRVAVGKLVWTASHQLFVEDYAVGRWQVADQMEQIIRMVLTCQGGDCDLVIEATAYQKIMSQLLAIAKKEMNLGMKIIPVSPHRDKFSRIISLQPLWEQGRLLIRPGMTELEEELSRFPRGEFDDLLDMIAQGFQATENGLRSHTQQDPYLPERYRRVAYGGRPGYSGNSFHHNPRRFTHA